MKAIEFPQQTTILAKDQPEYANLPVFISTDDQKQMISCHELDDEELELINKTKRIWQSQLTFGQHYHPSWVAVKNPFDVHEEVTQSPFLTINEAAKRYGEKVKCKWLFQDGDNWTYKILRINANFLRQMEQGSIKKVER